MLTCATCGNEEPEGSRFCGSCGAPYATVDQQPAAAAATEAPRPLNCVSCGNEEPEGSQFCGSCGAPFEPADQQLVHPAATETVAAEQPAPVETHLSTRRRGKRRLRWVSAGAAVALLAAGGAAAAVLFLAGGSESTEAVSTEEPALAVTSESGPLASSSTLAESIGPRFVELATAQSAVSARVRLLRAEVDSFAALRQAGDALAVSVVGTQGFLEGLVSTDSTEAGTLSLLHGALASHLAYAETISGLPARPRSFTSSQAQELTARAEQVQIAYSGLAAAEPTLSGIALSSFDHEQLLALVPAPKPPLSLATRRVIDLVPLFVGIKPDDPLSEGRCFGPYTGASLRVSGVVHRSGFIQCGDDADGDPSRASGVYRFSGLTFPAGSRLVRMTGQAVIDEFSSLTQRGSSVTWTVFYDGAPICSETVVWSRSRPPPRKLDCKFPSAVASGGLDVQRLRIQQVASLASSGTLWAGLFHPMVVVEVPR
jgi:hypothetical protein